MAGTKLILQKCMYITNVKVVKVVPRKTFQPENLLYESFVTQKFPDLIMLWYFHNRVLVYQEIFVICTSVKKQSISV